MTLSTHVLDACLGRPAAHVPVTLYRQTDAGDWVEVVRGRTGDDGRLRAATSTGEPVGLAIGVYRLDFDTAAYFAAVGQTGFYPQVSIAFEVTDPGAHHHVPLVLSPFAYSTYRGS